MARRALRPPTRRNVASRSGFTDARAELAALTGEDQPSAVFLGLQGGQQPIKDPLDEPDETGPVEPQGEPMLPIPVRPPEGAVGISGPPVTIVPPNRFHLPIQSSAFPNSGWVEFQAAGPTVITPWATVANYILLAHPDTPPPDTPPFTTWICRRSFGNATLVLPVAGRWFLRAENVAGGGVAHLLDQLSTPSDVAALMHSGADGAGRSPIAVAPTLVTAVPVQMLGANPFRTSCRIVSHGDIVVSVGAPATWAAGPPESCNGILLGRGQFVEFSGSTLVRELISAVRAHATANAYATAQEWSNVYV